MHKLDIESEIHHFVITNFLFGRPMGFKPGDSLLDNGVIDSTGVLELVAFLEEKYGIKVEDDEVTPENLDSLCNVVIYVRNKLGQSA